MSANPTRRYQVGQNSRYDIVIIGGGPAGLTAGVYTSRAGLKTLLLERGIFGGQIVNAPLVENYPGFPEGISGAELGELMHQQAVRYALESLTAEVTGVNAEHPYHVFTTEGDVQVESLLPPARSTVSWVSLARKDFRGVVSLIVPLVTVSSFATER